LAENVKTSTAPPDPGINGKFNKNVVKGKVKSLQ
jgi:hypothetical protein